MKSGLLGGRYLLPSASPGHLPIAFSFLTISHSVYGLSVPSVVLDARSGYRALICSVLDVGKCPVHGLEDAGWHRSVLAAFDLSVGRTHPPLGLQTHFSVHQLINGNLYGQGCLPRRRLGTLSHRCAAYVRSLTAPCSALIPLHRRGGECPLDVQRCSMNSGTCCRHRQAIHRLGSRILAASR